MAPKAKTLTLQLIDQRPSGYVLEGSTGLEEGDRISAPNMYFLKTESVVKEVSEDGGYKYRKIRHIEGCETIFVDEQVRAGIIPNPDRDKIVFDNGLLLVANEGLDRSRYAYLLACEFNENNPNRPGTAIPKFRVIEKEKEAEKFLISLDDKIKAFNILASLSTENASGFSYNEAKIDYLASLHGITSVESHAEKLQQLMYMAEANPTNFISSVANARESYKIDVVLAQQHNVISFAGDNASFLDGGLKFYKFESKQAAKRVDELVDYFLERGGDDYKTMKMALEAAQKKAVELA